MRQWIAWFGVSVVGFSMMPLGGLPGHAVPPPEDVPEEVLRTQLVLEGRSPTTGEPLTAGEHAAQQASRRELLENQPRELPPQVQQVVILLKLRRVLRPVLPIIP
ncbi:MAG: hypothetical protein OHK0037_03540 [Elainellaceae cyanobacterium]